jgi:Ohr subfamily peroxiredoxin
MDDQMTTPDTQVLYTARVHVTGGREGAARSSDGRLGVALSLPGGPGAGTNPEQLFAAGWSACFESGLGIAARQMHVALPPDTALDSEIDLLRTTEGYALRARLDVSLPGLDRAVAQALVDASARTCPYTKAVQGNINTTITLV